MMKNMVLCLLVIHLVMAVPIEDKVDFPIGGYHEHKWYSGYLNFTTGHFHYVFFDSQRDPDNDPVVLWLNGGPGCSSMIGMMLQNGPFILKTNSTEFEINENAWNMKANVIYLQSPGGVGFSKGFRDNQNNDTSVTQDNYQALVQFFTKFPNLKKNDFFIAGQSYAGIYIPFLAQQIITNNRLPSRKVTINLKGIMVGNPCTDPRECYERDRYDSMSIYQYQYLHNHGYITDHLYMQITGACTLGYGSSLCKELRDVADKSFDDTETVVNNIYQPCYHQIIPSQANGETSRLFTQSNSHYKVDAYKTCEDIQGIIRFLNQPLVHTQLHVDFVNYDICSDIVAHQYKQNPNASEWLYPILLKSNINILIYSGDVDANVPITGTMRWIERVKEKYGIGVMEPWREWWVEGLHKHQDQVGGMVWRLRGLTFASVKGAGHLVPRDKKKEALVLFQSFIFNTDLPYKSE